MVLVKLSLALIILLHQEIQFSRLSVYFLFNFL
jgi:hypothetical protein